MRAAINKNFDDFLVRLIESLDIPDGLNEQAKKRYDSLGKWLNRQGSSIRQFNPHVYIQGSFQLGTVIKPNCEDEHYDVDLTCVLHLPKTLLTQRALKELVGEEINLYVRHKGISSAPENGRRCWSINYSKEVQFHIDILPSLPDGQAFKLILEKRGIENQWAKHAIAITDKYSINYERISDDWLHSNPYGFAEWFREKMKKQYDERRKILAEKKKAKLDEIPEYEIKTPLQRVIQVLKRHRDIMFEDDQKDKPISIIITTLAALAYGNENNITDALFNILKRMPDFIVNKGGIDWVANPVNSLENFADKWIEYPKRRAKFNQWLNKVKSDFNIARDTDGIIKIAETLKPSFGEKIVKEAMNKYNSNIVTSDLMSSTTSLSLFNAPHKKDIELDEGYPIVIKGSVNITGWIEKDGFRTKQIDDNSLPVTKLKSLRFIANTNIERPFKVLWQVVNTGEEARLVNQLRGDFYIGIPEKYGLVRKETTKYRGSHWVECFIIKDNICVARSGEFVIKII
jgi:hypothetical protein